MIGGRRLPRIAAIPAAAALLAVASSARFWLRGGARAGAPAAVIEGVLPAIAAILVLALIVRRPAIAGRVAALIVSSVVSVYAAEIAVRAVIPYSSTMPNLPEKVRRAKAAGVTFDTRDRLEVVADLRAQGVRAYPAIAPAEMFQLEGGEWRSMIRVGGQEVMPLGGIASVVTVLDNESGRWESYTSDEQGFDNPPGLWASLPADVVLIGDSFTHGIGAPAEENLGAQIRRTVPRTINLGMGGSGPLLELAALREYGPLLRPRAVVWFYFEGNDLSDLKRELASPLRRYLDPGYRQDLAQRRAGIDASLVSLVDAAVARDRSLLTRARRILTLERIRTLAQRGSGGPRPPEADLDDFARILGEASRTVAGWGGRLHFVFLPPWERFARPGHMDDAKRDRVLQIAREKGLPVLDATDVLARWKDPLECFPFRSNGHYGALGYRLIGEATAEWVTSTGAIAPR